MPIFFCEIAIKQHDPAYLEAVVISCSQQDVYRTLNEQLHSQMLCGCWRLATEPDANVYDVIMGNDVEKTVDVIQGDRDGLHVSYMAESGKIISFITRAVLLYFILFLALVSL